MTHLSFLQKLTLRAKKSLRGAEDLSRQHGDATIKPLHLLHAIFTEHNSVGHLLLKNMGYTKELLSTSSKSKTHLTRAQHIHDATAQPLSVPLKKIITQAYAYAQSLHYPYVGTEHLIYALLASSDRDIDRIAQTLLQSAAGKKTQKEAQEKSQRPHKKSKTQQSHTATDAATGSMRSAKKAPTKNGGDPFAYVARMVDFGDVAMRQDDAASQTPHLDQFCTSFMPHENDADATDHKKIVGRDDETQRVINILGRKNKNNPLLLGEPGVGKTALVEHLATRIAAGDVPQHLAQTRILSLDLTALVAGTSFRGEFEERIKCVLEEAIAEKNIILFIDELHTIIGTGNVSGGLDAANILKPALARGALRMIGATTQQEYKKHIEKDTALARRFQKVIVAEPSPADAKRMLWEIRKNYETYHNITLTKDLVAYAVDLSVRYIGDQFLPDKAIDVIDETAARVRSTTPDLVHTRRHTLEHDLKKVILQKAALVQQERYNDASALRKKEATIARALATERKKLRAQQMTPISTMTIDDLAQTVALMVNMPHEKITQDPSRTVQNTEKILNQKIIGQKHAARTVHSALLRSFSGLSAQDRPLGSFLFLGPTGVGKTLSAKVIAEEVFGTADALVRIDMSEYMERHNIAKLLGAPAGYVGHGESTTLFEKVRLMPHTVVLFDEIEKAHPDVAHILLQILEDGFVRDAEGRAIDFTHAVVILTSNIGTTEFTSAARVGFRDGKSKMYAQKEFNALKDTVIEKLRKQLKPELLNRIDHIITFNALDQNDITRIVRTELTLLKKRLTAEKSVTVTIAPAVLTHVAQKSLSFSDGARAVRKNIQDMVELPLAHYLLTHKSTTPTRIHISLRGTKIVVTKR